jgi:hypothetical protein
MNVYKLNNINLSEYNLMPSQAPGSHLAIEGFLDFPKRIHKTGHSWGDRNGIEPYVSSGEIFFGGRDIVFYGLVKGNDRDEAHNNLMELYDMLDQVDELVTLECDWGTFQVLVFGEIQVSYLGGGLCTVRIPFREPEPDLSGGALPLSSDPNSINGIDGVDFNDLGFQLLAFEQLGIRATSMSGQYNRPRPKPGEFISYGKEGYQVTKTEAREYQIKGAISTDTWAELESIVKGLYNLFKQPGARVLYIKNDKIRLAFCREGFRVFNILGGSKWDATVEINLTEAEEAAENETYLFLGDTLNRYVTTTTGQKILIKI